MWTSVDGNANLSNMSGNLFESNKDLSLSEARSDLAKRELHVVSLKKCIGDLQRTEAQKKALHAGRTKRICRISSRFNKFHCKRNYCKQRKAIRSMHEIGKMKRAQVQQFDSPCELRENHETIQQFTSQRGTDEFYEQFFQQWVDSLRTEFKQETDIILSVF